MLPERNSLIPNTGGGIGKSAKPLLGHVAHFSRTIKNAN